MYLSTTIFPCYSTFESSTALVANEVLCQPSCSLLRAIGDFLATKSLTPPLSCQKSMWQVQTRRVARDALGRNVEGGPSYPWQIYTKISQCYQLLCTHEFMMSDHWLTSMANCTEAGAIMNLKLVVMFLEHCHPFPQTRLGKWIGQSPTPPRLLLARRTPQSFLV